MLIKFSFRQTHRSISWCTVKTGLYFVNEKYMRKSAHMRRITLHARESIIHKKSILLTLIIHAMGFEMLPLLAKI